MNKPTNWLIACLEARDVRERRKDFPEKKFTVMSLTFEKLLADYL
jgi:hypothetical protein